MKGSRAEIAGVREGDVVVKSVMVWGVADTMEGIMELVVRREVQ